MSWAQSLTYPLIFILIGLALPVLAWLLLRVVPLIQPMGSTEKNTVAPVEISLHNDAMLTVLPGGRIEFINDAAREWFDLVKGEIPNLERLARRARPSEAFLELCATEGRARFSINGRLADGYSYSLMGVNQIIVVVLRRAETPVALAGPGGNVSVPILRTVTEFGQAIAASLDLNETLTAILENVEKLVPSDMMEVKVWNNKVGSLTAYRFSGLPGMARSLEKVRDSQFGEYSSYLVQEQKTLFISDTESPSAPARYSAEGVRLAPMRSYIGVPMLAGGELVGTLEVGILAAEAFASEDLDIVQLIIGQAAIAIRNALLYEEQQKQTFELSGLARLAQSVGSLRDPNELYTRLVQSLSILFEVDVLGFLIYDESRRLLRGQNPFHGLPPQVVQVYQTLIAPGSASEQIIQSKDVILAENAATDERWQTLGLQNVAQAASLRDTILVPLMSSGRFLGYLQLSNHHQARSSAVNDSELRLLNIVANQVAAIIDNAILVQETRERVQRSESLRRISSIVSSSATLDEVLRFVVQELSNLLQADSAAVFLYDDQQGILRTHMPSLFGVPADLTDPLARLYVEPAQFQFTVTGSQRSFISGNLAKDRRILRLYRPLIRRIGAQSAIVVPLIARNRGLGELMLASRNPDFYDEGDLQLAATVAGQLAGTVESTANPTLGDEQLRRRSEQLLAISRIVRQLNATADINQLLQIVYLESLRTSHADCGAIMFFEPGDLGKENPKPSYGFGHTMPEALSAIEVEAIKTEKIILVNNLGESVYAPAHIGVRSALVAPIAHQGEMAGLIHLHSNKLDHFDEGVVEVIETLAVQAGIAIGNSQRFREQARRLEVLRRRNEVYARLVETLGAITSDQRLDESLTYIGNAISEATPFQVTLFSIYDSETGLLRRVTGHGMSPETLETLKSRQQPWQSVAQLFKPEFKILDGYFIPANKAPVIPTDVHLLTVVEASGPKTATTWDPDDLLVFPLFTADGNPLGLFSLDAPRDRLRPDKFTMESLSLFAAQTARVINAARRVNTLRGEVTRLSADVERQKNLLSVSQTHLPTLLHKDLEQTISISHLDQRGRRMRAGLALTEIISRQVDYSAALLTLGSEILTQFNMMVSILAEDAPEGPRILRVMGGAPRGANPEALFGQRNPLRQVLQTGEPIIVVNIDEDETWNDSPLLNALRAKSFLCLPIVVGAKPVAAVLSTSFEPLPRLTAEDQQVYHQLSRQVSITIQNISLLNETRQRLREVNLLLDFSRQLIGLAPQSILSALLESALRVVSSAHAGVVMLWDEAAGLLVPKVVANYADNENILGISYHANEGLPGRVYAERQVRRVDEIKFAVDYNLSAENLLKYRKATAGRLPVSSLVVPIQTVDRALGVLVLDNFNTSAAFRLEDEAMLSSLTQQVALSLENVRLIDATQKRAMQLQALNEVAGNITSSLNRDELTNLLLERMSKVVSFDTAILWMRRGDQMVVAASRGFADNEDRKGLTVAVTDSVLLNEMTRTGRAISVGDVRRDARFSSLVENPHLSWLGIPLIAKNETIGVIALEKAEANFYTHDLVQFATTFAGQSAVAFENANLFEESLARAAELDERSRRLATLNQFSGALARALTEEDVLRLTAEQLRTAFAGKNIWIVLSDHAGKLSLQSVLPEDSKAIMMRALPPTPLLQRVRDSLGVFITDDIAADAELKPLADLLPAARSLLILPLQSGQNVYILMLLTDHTRRFNPAEIDLARTIGNQATVALQSANLYEGTLATAQRLRILNEVSAQVSASLNPEETYKAVHEATTRLMPVDAFVIALLDEERRDIDGVYIFDSGQRINGVRLPYGQGIAGRVIATGEPVLTSRSEQVSQSGGVAVGERGNPNSIIAVPMFSGGKVIGSLSAQSYQYEAYTPQDQQILSTLANQAMVAIQNGRLFAQIQSFATTLEQRVVERTGALQREQRNTEMLLRILAEVSASLDLDRALSRTLALLNEAIGAEQGTIMLLHPEDNLLHYRAGYGYASGVTGTLGQTRGKTLRVGEGLAGWVVKNRQPALVPDLEEDPRWVSNPYAAVQHRSAIVSPLIVGEDVIGAIMVYHRNVNYFGPDALDMVRAIGSQVSIAINNAQLYELIRDQAERLGVMLRSQQVQASQSQAILEAVADGVLVTDSTNRITFLNHSAEMILNLREEKMVGHTLESFSGLFGRTTQTWIETIGRWSQDPAGHRGGETYAEQLTLENGRVILVHLAPVIWRNEFMGTVSIFRDITHEVEVDRLKSEFVATVSHELRTPMTSIRGYVDILLMGAAGALNENQQHFLDIVKNNTERLNVLVNDLLDISRIEAGRVILSMQAVDLKEVAEDIVAEVLRRSQEENRPMAIMLDAPADVPRVYGDLERVRQIVDNLVDNAYHYTPPNGRITIRIRPNGSKVQLDVEDNGVGIPPADQERVFERFFRGEDPLVLATPGTGLGLPIVKQLVEMHHGRIWMKSDGIAGRGSMFSVSLPLYETEDN